jgi:hypothetical protein
MQVRFAHLLRSQGECVDPSGNEIVQVGVRVTLPVPFILSTPFLYPLLRVLFRHCPEMLVGVGTE